VNFEELTSEKLTRSVEAEEWIPACVGMTYYGGRSGTCWWEHEMSGKGKVLSGVGIAGGIKSHIFCGAGSGWNR
jgi:hypothetical protein